MAETLVLKKRGLGASLGSFAAKQLAKYAASEFCKSVGILPDSEEENQLKEIIESVNKLSDSVDSAQKKLTYIGEFQKKIYFQMEANNYEQSKMFMDGIKTLADNDWNQFVNAIGNNQTLEDLAKDGKSLNALANILTNNDLKKLTTKSDMLSGNCSTNDNLFNNVLDSKKKYVDSLIPQQGTPGNDLVKILNESNETLLKIYTENLLAIQRIYVMQKTALYLKYNSSNKTLNEIVFTEKDMKISYDFDKSDETLYKAYEKKFNTLDSSVMTQVVSDVYDEKNFNGIQSAKRYSGVPSGDWVKDCVLYAWGGVTTESKAYKGFYDGIRLTAKGTYNGRSNVSTLDLNDANSPANDKPVLTYTQSPYLECEYLKQNKMSFSGDRNNKGGYSDSYDGRYMHSIDISEGIVVYGEQNVIRSDGGLSLTNRHQVSIDQFVQVNFPNKERAMFQITVNSAKLVFITMGNGGNYQWSYSDNIGNTPSTGRTGCWKGGGYSEIVLTSRSKEKKVKIKVDGERHKDGKNYKEPSLYLIAMN